MAGSGQMPDWPGVPLNVPRTGWGKISDTQYADDGKYGITEYVYAADSGDWVEAAHPPGYEDHDAYEIHGSATCAEGDLVQWWEGSLTDGTLVLFFEQHTGSHNYPLELDPDAKAIVSSGYATDPIMADHERHGFRGVAAKPYDISQLGRVLHRVIAEETR